MALERTTSFDAFILRRTKKERNELKACEMNQTKR